MHWFGIKEGILLSDEGSQMRGIRLKFKRLFLSSWGFISTLLRQAIQIHTCLLDFFSPIDVLGIWSTDIEATSHGHMSSTSVISMAYREISNVITLSCSRLD